MALGRPQAQSCSSSSSSGQGDSTTPNHQELPCMCPMLRSVTLDSCSSLAEVAVAGLCLACPHLEQLSLCYAAGGVTQRVMLLAGLVLRNLRSLSVGGCGKVRSMPPSTWEWSQGLLQLFPALRSVQLPLTCVRGDKARVWGSSSVSYRG
mmetsp:Transcript_20149/g.43908  ORF Transcript_20149/g.43908 Transcript_20149/m.43908 type:complete len:150 (-) Transcript_20149:139-588(-)